MQVLKKQAGNMLSLVFGSYHDAAHAHDGLFSFPVQFNAIAGVTKVCDRNGLCIAGHQAPIRLGPVEFCAFVWKHPFSPVKQQIAVAL